MNETDPHVSIALINGGRLGLCIRRFDELQRRQRLHLPNAATCWDYASLIDVVLMDSDSDAFRFTGKTVAQWMAGLRKHSTSEYERFRRRYESTVNRHLAALSRRPRDPDNHYCVELRVPPLRSSLPGLIRLTGLMRASVNQWLSTLRSLTSRGLKPEELEMSGVLAALRSRPGADMVTQAQILQMIDLSQVVPKFACESRFGFIARSGWKEECRRIPEREHRRRRLLGEGVDARHLIRFRHRSLGWSVVHTRYSDLVTERTFWWSVLDENGQFIEQPVPGFQSAEDAMAFAEGQMNKTFALWGKDQALTKWERYSLPGGDDYLEVLLQLDDWPYTYRPRHYRTRNVLVHVRTSVRHTQEGRRVLFLDEIQSDWHADLHAEARGEVSEPRRPSTPGAPFRKEWPLLSMKLMIWWAQRLGVDGLAWASADLQLSRWGKYGPPEILYRKVLPNAARLLATTLSLTFDQATLSVRDSKRRVESGRRGWEVRNCDDVPVTKPFRTRAQAEHFADLIGEFFVIDVPVLWINQLPQICSIPLYGLGTAEAWLASGSDR
ncbi:hypothetical protein [Paraburkholderia sp. JPY419]|uniref:hypothetical protein n=1 Tax=Paraburkholderia sp. JPY419 TaxID=667660 RepID=UPI003D22743A